MPPGELASLAWRLHTFVLERFRALRVQRHTYGVVRHGRGQAIKKRAREFLPAPLTGFAAAILILSIKTTQQVGYKVGGEYDLGASA